jgi:hypothetical protein
MKEIKHSKKMLIMNILDILKKYSDENHRFSQKQISDILESEYQMEADRKSIRRNLLDLEEFGFDLNYSETVRMVPAKNPETGKPLIDPKTGEEKMKEFVILLDFYLEREFTDSELRLLIDSMLFSQHIPNNQCRPLVKKLEGLFNVFFKNRCQYISRMPIRDENNKQLFLNFELLDEAISRNRKVFFKYLEYRTDKKMKHPRYGGIFNMSSELMNAVNNFVTGIYAGDKTPTFDDVYKKAFQMAWKDMSTHTLKIKEDYKEYLTGDTKIVIDNKKVVMQEIRETIRTNGLITLISAQSKDEFEKAHKDLCDYIARDQAGEGEEESKQRLSGEKVSIQVAKDTTKKVCVRDIYQHMRIDSTTFSYGQAQKLVNMLVKYLFVYNQLYQIKELENMTPEHTEFYHVPLDSIVLKAAGKKEVSWSQIASYDGYRNIQEYVTDLMKKKSGPAKSPFIYELTYWPRL